MQRPCVAIFGSRAPFGALAIAEVAAQGPMAYERLSKQSLSDHEFQEFQAVWALVDGFWESGSFLSVTPHGDILLQLQHARHEVPRSMVDAAIRFTDMDIILWQRDLKSQRLKMTVKLLPARLA